MTEFPGPNYWRGEHYGKNPFALRLLVIGESHYGQPHEAEDMDATERVVRNRIEHLAHGSFFAVVETILLGRKPLVFEVGNLWQSVSFLNYAPHMVVEGKSASLDHFRGARKRFAEAVRELQPQLVCFFSREAWHNRPADRESTWRDAFGVDPQAVDDHHMIYDYGADRALAVSFNHPSRLNKTALAWHQQFRDAYQERQAMGTTAEG